MITSLESITKLHLPKVISDGMILQRQAKVRIWGYAPARETVTLTFLGESHTTISDVNARWEIHLHDLEAGGPYEMTISTKNSGSITLNDILIGDIYVCAGQSNMEHNMSTLLPLYDKEVAECENTQIRQFFAPIEPAFEEQDDYDQDTGWTYANPKDILKFTGVGYFFAKEINRTQHVPVGIINTSQGGSPCESWMSEGALEKYPHYLKALEPYKVPNFGTDEKARVTKLQDAFYADFFSQDKGVQGTPWYEPTLDDSSWDETELPAELTKTCLKDLAPFLGIVWFRKTITISKEDAGKSGELILGTLIDNDKVFLNGTCIGETGYLYPRRRYSIPEGLLKEGENVIAVRLSSFGGVLSFIPDKDYEVKLDTTTIDLKNTWKYKIANIYNGKKPDELFLEWVPSSLFNGMLAPILSYTIKGVVWYQAESNGDRADEYRTLFPDLIKNWRNRFNIGDFPFYYVQLPNWGEISDTPEIPSWGDIRSAQESALSLPRTAMCVTYDVGEWNDLHPLDKQSVGYRLALLARRHTYGEKIVWCGPTVRSTKKEANKITITFDNIGSGLVTRDGLAPGHLFIQKKAGEFIPAKSHIEKDQIIIEDENMSEVTDLYYAYASSPETANLANKEGLPATPFHITFE